MEALEYAYPLRVRQYSYRPSSGGAGKYRGGDGLVREIELLSDARITLLADRRKFPPYGLSGGGPGALGNTSLITAGEVRALPGKCSIRAARGSIVRIETPGGGAWGVGSASACPSQ